ncbi:Leucyl/phenylalanyl-tRNA--protein transferase [Azospirillaceae bacterium]
MASSADADELMWFDPDPRGILPLESFHIPRRLRRVVRSERFEVRSDFDFEAVIRECAATTELRRETWINAQILSLYCDLHRLGLAHSVECWRQGRLVGGLYGVSLGGVFFGESMFSRETDASKVALTHLVARLRAAGYRMLDAQYVTSHLARFGAVAIPREEYHRCLEEALTYKTNFRDVDMDAALTALWESVSVD